MEIVICNQSGENKWMRYKKDFVLISNKALDLLTLNPNNTCSIIFVNDQQIKDINKQFRHKDVVTDVISFAMHDDDTTYMNNEIEADLGDIFINVNAIIRQAKEYNHSIRRETCFLFTHGLLHLLGYDHMQKDEEKIMNVLQEDILHDIVPRKV